MTVIVATSSASARRCGAHEQDKPDFGDNV